MVWWSAFVMGVIGRVGDSIASRLDGNGLVVYLKLTDSDLYLNAYFKVGGCLFYFIGAFVNLLN